MKSWNCNGAGPLTISDPIGWIPLRKRGPLKEPPYALPLDMDPYERFPSSNEPDVGSVIICITPPRKSRAAF